MNLRNFFSLLRISQWYKNLLVFVAIFFAEKFLDLNLLIIVVAAFFCLCFISSAGYIINDIKDYKKDREHPEKKSRPIAAGKVNKKTALVLAFILIVVSLAISYYLKPLFSLFPSFLFFNTILYTFIFKKWAVVDIHSISFNYLARAIAGAYVVSLFISPWFLLFIFGLSLFLAVTKRRGEIDLIAEGDKENKRKDNKKNMYNRVFLDWLMVTLLGILLLSYILYTFLAHEGYWMMLTIPFVSFMVFRYFYLVSKKQEIARKAELFFKDKPLLAAFICWIIVCFVVLYLL